MRDNFRDLIEPGSPGSPAVARAMRQRGERRTGEVQAQLDAVADAFAGGYIDAVEAYDYCLELGDTPFRAAMQVSCWDIAGLR